MLRGSAMLYKQNGTSLWYSTPDAPAPQGQVLAAPNGRATVVFNVGVHPINPRTSVEVRYRLNGAPGFKVPATLARTDIRTDAQYFSAAAPEFRVGDRVDYVAVAFSPGKQVPSQADASAYSSSFQVGSPNSPEAPKVGQGISALAPADRAPATEHQWSGQLRGPTNEPMSYSGCHIEAYFDRFRQAPSDNLPASSQMNDTGMPVEQPASPGSVSIKTASRASALSDASGHFTLAIPQFEDIAGETVRLVVSSPRGRIIAQKEISAAQIGDSIAIDVQKFASVTLGKSTTAPTRATRHVRGRIVERNGKTLPASIQVLLLGREEGADEDAAFNPVLVTKADSAGYFLGEVPNSKFSLVVAVVGGVPGESPVRLEDSTIPARVVLVVELPVSAGQQTSSDCHCASGSVPRTPSQQDVTESPGTFSADLGTGQCIKFNVPNRAIEEFNFYSVVRTTQPDIVGITTGMHGKPATTQGVPLPSGQIFGAAPAPTHSGRSLFLLLRQPTLRDHMRWRVRQRRVHQYNLTHCQQYDRCFQRHAHCRTLTFTPCEACRILQDACRLTGMLLSIGIQRQRSMRQLRSLVAICCTSNRFGMPMAIRSVICSIACHWHLARKS